MQEWVQVSSKSELIIYVYDNLTPLCSRLMIPVSVRE